jgi:hypothetical protein
MAGKRVALDVEDEAVSLDRVLAMAWQRVGCLTLTQNISKMFWTEAPQRKRGNDLPSSACSTAGLLVRLRWWDIEELFDPKTFGVGRLKPPSHKLGNSCCRHA